MATRERGCDNGRDEQDGLGLCSAPGRATLCYSPILGTQSRGSRERQSTSTTLTAHRLRNYSATARGGGPPRDCSRCSLSIERLKLPSCGIKCALYKASVG